MIPVLSLIVLGVYIGIHAVVGPADWWFVYKLFKSDACADKNSNE